MTMVPTDPPVARCLSCRRRYSSSVLCPVCQCCMAAGCGHADECLAMEDRLRVELSEEGAAGCSCLDPDTEAGSAA